MDIEGFLRRDEINVGYFSMKPLIGPCLATGHDKAMSGSQNLTAKSLLPPLKPL